jgi:glyoxylase-like metal-dependent hydrolase (beta-lactamase superfamily II)
VLIDAGTGKAEHLAALDRALDGAVLVAVIVTHNHSDHASGVVELAERYPSATFWKYPWPERDGRYAVPWQRLADGDRVDAGDGTLEVVHTPGHAPDHICLWDASSRLMFSSDLALASTTVVVPASAGGDMAAYLVSLEHVRALAPLRLLPAHGPVIEAPEALLGAYVRHRRAREAELLARLVAAPSTLEALTTAMYPGLAPAVVPSAADGLLAHLIKLERERRVRRNGEIWVPVL